MKKAIRWLTVTLLFAYSSAQAVNLVEYIILVGHTPTTQSASK